MKAMYGEQANDPKQDSFLKITLPMFAREGVRLVYQGKYVFPGVPSQSFLNYPTTLRFLDTLDFLKPFHNWITIIGDIREVM